MKLVINGGEKIEAYKIEKGTDFIKLYDSNNNNFQTFQGIPDFSKFTVEDGEFTIAPPDDITELQLAIAELAELMEVLANG